MKAPTKRPTGTHPEEQPRGAHPGTNTSSTGGCWKTLLLQTAPGGPGAEDTPQLPWDQMVLWVCRAASHIFPRDGQICHGQVPQNSLPRVATNLHHRAPLQQALSPPSASAKHCRRFPLLYFRSSLFFGTVTMSTSSPPILILSSRQETRVTPRCLNLLLCAPSLVSSCRNHFCKIPGKGKMSGLCTEQLKP